MSRIQRIFEKICYGDIDKEFYVEHRELLDTTNYWAVLFLYLGGSFLNPLLFVISLWSRVNGNSRLFYGVGSILAFFGVWFVLTVVRRKPQYVNVVYYIFNFVLFSQVMFTGIYSNPNLPAVNFFVFMIVVPAVFIDRPIKGIVQSTLHTVVFCIANSYLRRDYPIVLEADLLTAGIVYTISVIFSVYIRNLHLITLQSKVILQQRSELDGLSEIYNKVHCEKLCEEYLNFFGKEKNCSLWILDLDNFKQVNDTYGHQIGDEVIHRFGHILKKRVLKSNVIGRVGGDEFTILLKGISDPYQIQKFAEQLFDEMRKISDGLPIEDVTCSIGICIKEGVNATYREMFAKADAALYEVKNGPKGTYSVVYAGRNKFRSVLKEE